MAKNKGLQKKFPSQLITPAMLGLLLTILITACQTTGWHNPATMQGDTSGITNSPYPIPEGTETFAAIATTKAADHATYQATTRTPETSVFLPTGIYDDQRGKVSAALIFIDALNAYGGFIDVISFGLYAGAPVRGVHE
jgi:hypothetical protein